MKELTFSSEAKSTEQTLRRLFLMLFLRGRTSRGLQKDKAPQTVGRKLALALTFYGLFGCMAFLFADQTVLLLSTYMHAMTFLFLGMFVATSAGEVLFNKEEGDILLHRPISPRALLWAKISVLVQVALWLAGSINLAALFVGTRVGDGGWLFPLAHILSTVLEALFCTSAVVVLYQLCLRWFGRERLDAFMTGAQVVLTVLLVVGGQLVPQLLIRFDGIQMASIVRWWIVFLPPAWFAGIDDAIAGSGALYSWGLAALGVTATLTSLYVAFSRLALNYHAGLQSIAESGTQRASRPRRRWLQRLVRVPPLSWWLRDPVSRASFLLVGAYIARDRETKLRLYPGLVPMLVMPIIILIPRAGREMRSSAFGIAFAGSYLAMVPLFALGMLEFSQQWAASDVFRIAPISGPSSLNNGARRAVLLLLTVPMLVLFGAVVYLMVGRSDQMVMMLPGMMLIPLYALFPGFGGNSALLSRPPEEAKAAGRSLRTLIALPISLAVAFLSNYCYSHGWLTILLAVEAFFVVTTYVAVRMASSNTPWEPLA